MSARETSDDHLTRREWELEKQILQAANASERESRAADCGSIRTDLRDYREQCRERALAAQAATEDARDYARRISDRLWRVVVTVGLGAGGLGFLLAVLAKLLDTTSVP